MTHNQFNEFQSLLLSEVIKLKDTKGREYARSEERFANFNRLSTQLNLPRLQIALVYLTKHLDAIAHYAENGHELSEESIRGRFIDAICYLTLMAGMAEESTTNQTKDITFTNALIQK